MFTGVSLLSERANDVQTVVKIYGRQSASKSPARELNLLHLHASFEKTSSCFLEAKSLL